jgi:hypothetical protein
MAVLHLHWASFALLGREIFRHVVVAVPFPSLLAGVERPKGNKTQEVAYLAIGAAAAEDEDEDEEEELLLELWVVQLRVALVYSSWSTFFLSEPIVSAPRALFWRPRIVSSHLIKILYLRII